MSEKDTPKGTGATAPVSLDIGVDELLEALSDLEKAQALMAERGWTSRDLVRRAEALKQWLAESVAAFNVT